MSERGRPNKSLQLTGGHYVSRDVNSGPAAGS